MKQEKIKYRDIMSLGFEEDFLDDKVYFDEYGFDYCVITKKLTDNIYLDWDKVTQLCEMIRINNEKDMCIKAVLPIQSLDHLKEIISFFCEDREFGNTVA